MAATTIQPVASCPPLGRTTHQEANAMSNTDIASYVANAPRWSVGPEIANSAAAKKAARFPYSLLTVPHRNVVATSMKIRERTRAPVSPPMLAASAPIGGNIMTSPLRHTGGG